MNQTPNKTKPTVQSGGRKLRNDIIFIAALLIIVSLMGLAFFFLREEGNTVIVEVDGKPFATCSLSEDRTLEIRTGENGKELNLLVIKDGKAYMETATCPDGICAAHKPIFREGESIVCLPHRVVVTVHADDAEAPDILA